MKATILSAILILTTTVGLKAQKLIAVQSGDNATFYTSLDSALLHAENGDDIYLPGGYIETKGTIKIDKAVNLIGVGYNPYSNPATQNTIIDNRVIEISSTVSGGRISGIFGRGTLILVHDTVSNYIVNRCLFQSIGIGTGNNEVVASNILISESIIEGGVIYANSNPSLSPRNVSILNCVIKNLSSSALIYSYYQWKNLTCKNCLFLGSNSNFSVGVEYSFFESCIFYIGGYISGTSNSYRNCIFTCASDNISNLNFINNCIFSQDPNSIFIDPQFDINPSNLTNDYHLQSTSPGKNAGTDGKDIGIYGGLFPWKEGGLPYNPHIQSKVVSGTTDNSGNIKVNINVEAQDH